MTRLVRCAIWTTGGSGVILLLSTAMGAAEDWLQLKYDARHSGNMPGREVSVPLGLAGAVALEDAIFTAPVIGEGRVYAVDGSGTAFCLDAATLGIVWKVHTRGGAWNCNNVSSPALAGRYLHFGTMGGTCYVIDRTSGQIVKELACGEPIFCTPVVGQDRVYFATLGARVYALTPDGTICWTWDFVRHQLGFTGDRWCGRQWSEHLQGRVTNAEQFLCSRDMALDGRVLVIPAGGSVVWLEDTGPAGVVRQVHRQHTSTLGLSIGEDGTVCRQWYWLDNGGQVDMLRLGAAKSTDTILRDPAASQLQFDEAIEKIVFTGREGSVYVPGSRPSIRSMAAAPSRARTAACTWADTSPWPAPRAATSGACEPRTARSSGSRNRSSRPFAWPPSALTPSSSMPSTRRDTCSTRTPARSGRPWPGTTSARSSRGRDRACWGPRWTCWTSRICSTSRC